MSEKIGGAKGTELDDDFVEMERKVDVFGMMVTDLMNKTHEFLQPNPASRAKLMAFNSFSKIRGQAKSSVYPQPEGTLGETMIKYGKDLGEDRFGACLGEAGEAFKDLADIKYALEDNVKQNFLDPLNQLANKDLKEVNHHRKKLSGRRLDYDCKRRKKEKAAGDQGFGDQAQGSPLKSPSRMRAGSGIADDELKTAEEKFEETKAITETAMFNLLDNDVEQITQLQAFVEAITNYHKQSASILERLCETLDYKREDAVSRPKSDHVVKRVTSFRRSASPSPFNDDDGFGDATSSSSGGGYNFPSTASLGESVTKPKPCCKAMYDFEPENEGELGFSEGDIIDLIQKVDDNWFEGSIRGQTGYFPVNYVEVIVDVD
ncbi:endophilin-A3-like isoform X1 [Octopus vulgaris]|uniref:Endophilin-A3-like isoform X1 n=1 Tax=Octopus vulgaris TaxID=6645 RepID=A0AA36BGQ1_OCTVU|nr:endophilin-A3-like isoform X1 [Octopus vulgaris]